MIAKSTSMLFYVLILTIVLGITKSELSSQEIELISPDDKSEFEFWDELTNNRFSWLAFENKKKYEIQFSFDNFQNYENTFTVYANEQDTIWFRLLKYFGEKIHYWRVKTWDDQGNRVYSEVRQWIPAPYFPTSKPKLLYPYDHKRFENTRDVEFSWKGVPRAVNYEIEVYKNGSSKPFYSFSIDSVNLRKINGIFYCKIFNIFEESSIYLWRVRGTNSAGAGPWSDFVIFTIQNNIELQEKEVQLITPRDSSLFVWEGQTFRIKGSSRLTFKPIQGFYDYIIQIYTNDMNDLVHQIEKHFYELPDTVNLGILELQSFEEYQFRILAYNDPGDLIISDTFRLFPSYVDIPKVTEFIYPRDGEIIDSEHHLIPFEWKAVDNSRYYEFEWYREGEEERLFYYITYDFNYGQEYSTFLVNAENRYGVGKYKWRVRGENEYLVKTGPWSDFAYFSVEKGTSVAEKTPDSFTIYPNPADDQIILMPGLFNGELLNIEIISPSGRTIKRISAYQSGTYIDVSDLSQGFYYLRINHGINAFHKKLIIVR
jgi:hypothetical protein